MSMRRNGPRTFRLAARRRGTPRLSNLPPSLRCAPASVQTGTREHGAARTAPAWRAGRRLRFARSELRPKSFASQNNRLVHGSFEGVPRFKPIQGNLREPPAPGCLEASFLFSSAFGQAEGGQSRLLPAIGVEKRVRVPFGRLPGREL